jgi:uncharacterized membrane protein YbhN (UPF0104 family)
MESEATHPPGSRPNGRPLTPSFVLSYLLGFTLLAALIIYGNVWDFLANSRLLDLLIAASIIKLHDKDVGFIEGIPDLQHYVKSLDPVDWRLILLALGLFLLVWILKANQFHLIARLCGVPGSLSQQMRAHFYGLGVSHLLPFGTGDVATAVSLEGQGVPLHRAAVVIYISRLFIIFEIAVFALGALFFIGWSKWLWQIALALVILGVAYWLVRPSVRRNGLNGDGPLQAAAQAIGALTQRPAALITLCLLSLVSFALFDVAAYIVVAAFTGTHVILDVDSVVLIMGVVAYYIARLVPITPGGIGQGEWAMYSALLIGGVGHPDAVAVAVIVGFFRYLSVVIPWGAVMLAYGIETNLRYVLDVFRGRPVASAEA